MTFSTTRAPGTRQLLLTFFLWVPVCIKRHIIPLAENSSLFSAKVDGLLFMRAHSVRSAQRLTSPRAGRTPLPCRAKINIQT